MNKKGFFFTMMSMLLVFGFVLLYTSSPSATPNYKKDVVRDRVSTLNSFVKDVEEFYVDSLITQISSQSFGVIANNLDKNVVAYDERGELTTAFRMSANNLIPGEIARSGIIDMAKKYHGVQVQFEIDIRGVKQTEPWFLDVLSVISVNVDEIDISDDEVKDNPIAKWNKRIGTEEKPHITKVPVNGLINPLTMNPITKAPTTPEKIALSSVLGEIYYNDSNYENGIRAPNYLQRFYKQTNSRFETSDCCGIFALVKEPSLLKKGDGHVNGPDGSLPCAIESYLDYTLFDGVTTQISNLYSVQGIHLHKQDDDYGSTDNFFQVGSTTDRADCS